MFSHIFAVLGAVVSCSCVKAKAPELLMLGRFITGINCGRNIILLPATQKMSESFTEIPSPCRCISSWNDISVKATWARVTGDDVNLCHFLSFMVKTHQTDFSVLFLVSCAMGMEQFRQEPFVGLMWFERSLGSLHCLRGTAKHPRWCKNLLGPCLKFSDYVLVWGLHYTKFLACFTKCCSLGLHQDQLALKVSPREPPMQYAVFLLSCVFFLFLQMILMRVLLQDLRRSWRPCSWRRSRPCATVAPSAPDINSSSPSASSPDPSLGSEKFWVSFTHFTDQFTTLCCACWNFMRFCSSICWMLIVGSFKNWISHLISQTSLVWCAPVFGVWGLADVQTVCRSQRVRILPLKREYSMNECSQLQFRTPNTTLVQRVTCVAFTQTCATHNHRLYRRASDAKCVLTFKTRLM